MVYPENQTIQVGQDETSRSRIIPRIRLYDKNDTRETFEIFIQKLSKTQGMNQVKLAGKLFTTYGNNISTWFINNTKMKVLCNSASIANEIANNHEILIDYNVSIKYSNIEVKGKLPIPSEYTEQQIFELAECLLDKSKPAPHKIVEVVRIQRTKFHPKETKYDTDTVIITFDSITIPKYIKFECLIIPVYPYVQRVLQCQNCWAFGHSTKACRGRKRCVSCGLHDDHAPCNTYKCISCNGTHRSNSKTCPIIKNKEEEMKEKARLTIYMETNTPEPEPFHVNLLSFPPLPSKKQNPTEKEYSEPVVPMDDTTCRKRNYQTISGNQPNLNLSDIKSKFNKSLKAHKPSVDGLLESLVSESEELDKSILLETYFNNKLEEMWYSLDAEMPLNKI